ncbi:metal-dependent hydrolase family protein [Fusibacter ferrireducens]|uniref:Amidohydrolase family protein n=1 Tax=Fusibacter ferrireducens TaxID=2785058 RepID=A0ABR9ZSK1_9FIRM|nr:amidohydrolase family protein [Fusibacter ferrireducens]MBF4693445.1 amidohydrolase family protein [Fusibacter ferrireducens]
MKSYKLEGRVINGLDDHVIEKGCVLVEQDKIVFVGTVEECPNLIPELVETIQIPNATIMPGFIDCHAHVVGADSQDYDECTASHMDLILNAAHDLGQLLDSGFTSIRDMGLFGPSLSRAVDLGLVRGPKIMPSGRIISVTAGHGDHGYQFSKAYLNEHSPLSVLADGVPECLEAVRTQFRNGAKFIKVMATGGVSSPIDKITDVQFSETELKAIVAEAERRGTYVAAHCTGTEGTLNALKAGVKSIEHGVMLDESCIQIMVENDCTLVSTLAISLGIPKMKAVLPAHIYEKGKVCAEKNLKSIEMARAAGIRIAFGTDYTNSKNTRYSDIGKEFEAMIEAGLTPMEAIQSATKNAAYLLKQSDEVGTIEVGKTADLVMVSGNPLEDISVLRGSEKIKIILQNGVLVKRSE